MSVILPAEADVAVEALRLARERLGEAVDEMVRFDVPAPTVVWFADAHVSVATLVEKLAAAIGQTPVPYDEERRVDGGLFPWMEGEP